MGRAMLLYVLLLSLSLYPTQSRGQFGSDESEESGNWWPTRPFDFNCVAEPEGSSSNEIGQQQPAENIRPYSNTTVALNAGGSCNPKCIRDFGPLHYFAWSARSVSTTVTAATVVTIINRANGGTRVSTITNPEINTADYPKPTNVNGDGVHTQKITDYALDGKGFTTITLYVYSASRTYRLSMHGL